MFKIGSFITRLLSAGSYPPRPWRFRIAALLVLVGLAWPTSEYLSLILRNPQRTGMLVIGSTFEAPWDINPWCEENIATLEKLDKHNLSLRRLADPSLLAFGQWAELCDDVEHLVEGTDPAQPLLVYINLHGVINRDGQPYLLVHDSQPLDTSTWLSLDVLIQRIRQSMPHSRPLVVAIEGTRQHALRLPGDDPESTFADAVRRWYASLQQMGSTQGLSIIVSSTTRFDSVEATGVDGDLFTCCLAEALCGRCDQTAYGGNADQRIEWEELQRYVHDQVEQRSRRLRIVPQLTESFTSDDGAAFLAWNTALDSKALLKDERTQPSATAVEALTAAWKQIYTFQPQRPWHEDPFTWGMLKRTMVAWEQAIFGGNDARSRSRQFEQAANTLITQLAATISKRDAAASLEVRLCNQSTMLWQQLAQSPSFSSAQQLLSTQSPSKLNDRLCAVPLLAQLLEQPELSIWSQPERLRQVALLESQIEQTRSRAAQLPGLSELSALELQIDTGRRQLEDRLCADIEDASWGRRAEELASLVERWQAKINQLVAAIEFDERMLARLPTVCRIVDRLDNYSQADESLSRQVDLIEKAVWHHHNCLADAISGKAVDLDLDLDEAEQRSQEFFSRLAQLWQQTLSQATSELPSHAMTLESFLTSGLLPIEIGSVDKAVQLRLATHRRLAELRDNNQTVHTEDANLDFSRHNEQRLVRWLDWSSDATSHPSVGSMTPERKWSAVTPARVRACFGVGPSVIEPLNAWTSWQTNARQITASTRVLNDFWKLPACEGQDYFAAVAGKLLADVHARDRVSLENLLQNKVRAAREGLQLDCECVPVWNEHTPRVTACRLTSTEWSLPEGLAGLQIMRLDTKQLLSPILGFETANVDQQPYRLPIYGTDTAASRGPAVAVARFRGHRFQSSFDLCPAVGHATVGAIPEVAGASIHVQSTARKLRARMLVLDCSASMHQPQAVEGTFDSTNPAQSPSRLDAARLAFQSIMEHWRGQPDHVGVMLYGHRVALGTKEQGKLFQTRYLTSFPLVGDIEAFEDVETILPPGRFGDQELAEVQQRLQAVVPWGQTPLYLSVLQATEELARYRTSENSHAQTKCDLDVIVVSDGRNYQFNPTSDKNITLDQAVERARQLGVRVHVIGFGIAANELEQATSEFTHIAQQTGGSVCMEVQTALQLVNRIDALTEPESFRVRLPDGRWIDSRCGETVSIPNIIENNTPIVVDYQRTSTLIPTSPGAAMRLTPGPVNRLVRAQPLFHSATRTSISTPEGQVSPFEIVVNVTRSETQLVEWQLGLERRDELVAQRPKYLWVETQPKPTDSRLEPITYIVSDGVWQAETTQPVLGFQTQDWSEDIESAMVKFWCSDQLPAPVTTFSCAPAKLANSWLTTESQLEAGQVQYQLQAEPNGVTLVLMHAQASDVLGVMPLIGQLPSGTKIERRYCPAQRISIHRFQHASLPAQPEIAVAIYSVNDFKTHALRSTGPVEVRLPKNMASVAVGAPALR